jgi:hypothetical protein
MSRPSWREFRRHRAVEQGCSLPPPAPQASIVLLPVRKLQNWPRNPLAKLGEKIPLEPRAKTNRLPPAEVPHAPKTRQAEFEEFTVDFLLAGHLSRALWTLFRRRVPATDRPWSQPPNFILPVKASERSKSVPDHDLPKIISMTQQPRTCSPGVRQWPRISASSQPALSRATASIGSRSKERSP